MHTCAVTYGNVSVTHRSHRDVPLKDVRPEMKFLSDRCLLLIFRFNSYCGQQELPMKKPRFSVDEIVSGFIQAELGLLVADLIRHVAVSAQTLYRWKKQYAELEFVQVRELKQVVVYVTAYQGYSERLACALTCQQRSTQRKASWSVRYNSTIPGHSGNKVLSGTQIAGHAVGFRGISILWPSAMSNCTVSVTSSKLTPRRCLGFRQKALERLADAIKPLT